MDAAMKIEDHADPDVSGIYSDLDHASHVRLLTIRPGSSEPLFCKLTVVAIDDEQRSEYETISYVWGNPEDRKDIILDGHIYSVPLSCWAVLKRVRLPDKPRVVWIDAVCINQKNRKEREHQVSIMGQIYASGTCNLIYWCEEHECLQAAIDGLHRLLNEATPTEVSDKIFTIDGVVRFAESKSGRFDGDHSALIWLFSTEWIRRVWTLQEAVSASRNLCMCGDFEVDLSAVTLVAAYVLSEALYVSQDLIDAVWPLALLRWSLGFDRGPHALRILALLTFRKCLLSVDHVYGALGLMRNCNISPDYRKTISEVSQEYAVWYINSSSSLMLLGYALHGQCPGIRDIQAVPSWVPDWSQSFNHEKHAPSLSPDFNAGKAIPIQASAHFGVDGKAVLLARGVRLSLLSMTAELQDTTRTTFTQPETRKMFLDTLKSTGIDEIELAIATTLCAGAASHGIRTGPEVVVSYRALMDGKCAAPRSSELVASPNTKEDQKSAEPDHPYLHAMAMACTNRKAFATRDGQIGIGPRSLQEGDVAAVLFGYELPVILRPYNGHFLYLGGAYIYGVMDGEALTRHRETGGTDVVFEIC